MPTNALTRIVNQLWPQARATALRCCGRTMHRLNRGDGGLYTSDDLLQDLYIEFHDTVRRWLQEGGNRDDLEPLWERWRSVLWGGARRIIRRKPYRLWQPPEEPVDPTVLALDAYVGEGDAQHLSYHALEALIEVPEADSSELEDALHEAWAELPALDRRALYMRVVMGYSGVQIARELQLLNPNAAYCRIYSARKRLRQRLTAKHGSKGKVS